MRTFACYAFTIGAAAVLLAGCGGSQPPIGAPGAMPQNITTAAQAVPQRVQSAVAPQAPASSRYVSLYSFGVGSDGQTPKAGVIDVDGILYGTTYGGGKHGNGTVFSVSTGGLEKVLYSFGDAGKRDGANPSASLVAVKGLLYGTTQYGGYPSYGCNTGTVFRASTVGREKVLYRFWGYSCDGYTYYDGANPVASLIDVNGRLYSTTYGGGFNEFYGTVFRISTSGRERVLYSFDDFSGGANPGANLLNVNGTLYGTTVYGQFNGSNVGYGTVFGISTTGTERVLNSFGPEPYGPDGCLPEAGLISVKSKLYGTTANCGVYEGGTAFSITTAGQLTNLHSFGSGSDGSGPFAPLLDVRGTLYGTTAGGGAHGKGTIFSLSFTGEEKLLHSFGYGSDGATPLAGLTDVKGTLYGTTSAGGEYGDGTVFALRL